MAGDRDLRHVTRDALVHAAAEVFAASGYEGARVQDIARRAGFTTGAIYANFDGKTDLLAAVIERHGREFLDSIEAIGNPGPVEDVLQALALTTMVGRRSPYQRILADACAVAARDTAVREALLPLLEEVKQALDALLAHAQQARRIDPAYSLRAALVHLALTLLLGSVFVRAMALAPPDEGGADLVVSRFLGGLEAAPTTTMVPVKEPRLLSGRQETDRLVTTADS